MAGQAAGTTADGRLGLSSRLDYTTQTCLAIACQLTADELRLLVAHEFGHALMHCLDCDSAISYAWHTLERVVVTETDVLAYRALNEVPSGQRVDGQLLTALR